MSNSSNLLEALTKISEENLVSVYVPSLDKTTKFRALNVKQQKDLIKTAMDGPAAGASLNQVLNEIILSNSVTDYEYKVYDRYAIIVALRSHCIDDTFKMGDEQISLSETLKSNISNFKKMACEDSIVIDFHSLKVRLDLPTLARDSNINEKFIKNIKGREKNTDYGEAIGNLYIYEIIKFINSINLQDSDSNHSFESLSFKDCLTIVENLPASLNNQIIKYIESIRDIENCFLDTEFGQLEINAAFFTNA